jgi:hypothetical protein
MSQVLMRTAIMVDADSQPVVEFSGAGTEEGNANVPKPPGRWRELGRFQVKLSSMLECRIQIVIVLL